MTKKKPARVFDFYPLEDRILLSADGFDDSGGMPNPDADYIDQLMGQANLITEEPPPSALQPDDQDDEQSIDDAPVFSYSSARPLEVIFVDAGVEDAEILLNNLRDDGGENTQWLVVHFDSDRDGIDQITETLVNVSSVDAIHLLSHGDGDGIQLGNTRLTTQSAPSYAGQLAHWKSALDTDADLLIYGCDLASTDDGQELIAMLSAVCDCDVAASDDLTGHKELGGNWILEYAFGDVETDVAFSYVAQASWRGTLDITSNLVLHNTFDTDASDSSGNNYDGTLTNGAVVDTNGGTNQIGDGKLSLDGSNDYVDFSAHAANLQGITEGTISAWIYHDVNSRDVIFETSDSGDANSRLALFRDSDGSLDFFVREGSTTLVDGYTAAGVISQNTWTHVAVTVDGSGNKLFVNGVQQSVTYTDGSSSSTEFFDDVPDLDFGSWGVDKYSGSSFTRCFDGFIDDGRVYDRALTGSDITELHNYAGPQTFTVTNTNDSGVGSLRQAILDANANAGIADTINFDISAALVADVHTISLSSLLPAITDAVIIDGSTEGDYVDGRPVIEIDGNSLAGDGIYLTATSDGSTIRGLIINEFGDAGILLYDTDGNTIVGNWLGTDADGQTNAGNGTFGIEVDQSSSNQIGGSALADRNIISGNTQEGISIWSSSSLNVLQGNYIGVDKTGNTGLGNSADGIVIGGGANNNTIGGDRTAGEGNVISGQLGATSDGIEIDNAGADNNKIYGNYIGTNFDGTTAIGNARHGVVIYNGVQGTLVGGTGTGQGNVISGNTQHGVVIDGNGLTSTSGNIIAGNFIGVDVNGTGNLGNLRDGVRITGSASNNVIGGESLGAGNIIAFNSEYGVQAASGTGIVIARNSIHSNTLLGIELGIGANNSQASATLTSADTTGTQVTINGTLSSLASTSYRIEFYANDTGDASGYGEGQTLIGVTDVTTDGTGNASFSPVLTANVAGGSAISAIVSRLDGGDSPVETSEFALNVGAASVNVAPTDIVFDSETASEVDVNTEGANEQIDPAIAAFEGGGHIVVWVSRSQDADAADKYGIYGQRYNADGLTDGVEFLVTSETADSETNPSVTTFSDGGFVVTWQDQVSGVMAFTEARVFNSDGTAATNDFAVSSTIDGNSEGYQPTTVALNSTQFVVLWSNEIGGSTYEIAGQIYDRTGATVGSQFTVGSLLGSSGLFGAQTEVTLLDDGGFAAAWRTNDGSLGTRFAVMNSDGSIRTAETTIAGGDNIADISSLAGGGFVVVYDKAGELKATLYDANGTVDVAEFDVNTTTSAARYESTVTRSSDGFVVVWESDNGDSSGSAILAQRFDVSGNKIDGEIVVNTTISGAQQKPEVVETASGEVIAVWQSENVDTALTGIVSRVIGTGTASVDENAANGTRVAQALGARDPDAPDTVSFALTDTAGGRFAINSTTGEVTVANGLLLDYETATSHDITVRATDSNGNTYDEVLTISVTDVTEPATLTVPIAQSVDEDVALTFSTGGGNAIVIESGSLNDPIVTATLSVTSGTLTLATTTGITFLDGTSNGESSLTISGTESDLNTALDGLQFLGDQDYNGSDTLTVTTGSPTTAENNLYARYEFLNGATTDESGNGYDGVASGDPTLTSDVERGDVLTFDGDDLVSVTNGTSGLGDEVTISAWVNLDAGQQDNVFLSIGDEFYVILDNSNTSLSMGIHANGFTTSSGSATHNIAGDGWNHVAATIDDVAKQVRLYLNGELIRSSSYSFADIDWATAASPNITIGGLSDGSSTLTGSLDDVRVYDRVLTETEVIATMGDNGFDSETVAVTVNPVNDAPVLTNGVNGTATEGSGIAPFTASAVSDVDSPDFNGGSLTLTIAGGGDATETLFLAPAGGVSVSGSDVSVSGVTIGTISGGTSGTPLVVSFTNTDATLARVDAVYKAMGIANFADNATGGVRSLEVVLTDGDGGTSNTATADVTFTPVNDAPVLDNTGSTTLPTITKSQTNNGGVDIATLIASAGGDRITDVDSGALEGIAITSLASGNGTWEFSVNAGVSWTSVGAVSSTSALLLGADDLVRFMPDGVSPTTASFDFQAWDQTTGTAGTKADASTGGGATAFSTATETANITVVDVNTAPVLDDSKSPVLSPVDEDAGAPVGVVGSLISELVDFATPAGQVDNVTDADSGAGLGIAITSADTTNGTWFYSIDNGSNWNALGAVSDSNARLLGVNASTRLYFQANADYHGTLANAITFHAWDQTSGSIGSTADLTGFGSKTLLDNFSAVSYSNDDGTHAWSTGWIESDSGGATSGDIQVSSGRLRIFTNQTSDNIYRQLDLTGATGATLSLNYDNRIDEDGGSDRVRLQISDNNGTTYTTLADFDRFSNTSNTGSLNIDIGGYISSDTRIRFNVTTFDNDNVPVYFDNVQVTATGYTAVGGTSAFSSATDTASLTVDPVADTPSITGTTTNEDTQSASGLVITRNSADGAEVTHYKITGISDGTLYKNDGVTQITNGSFITIAEGTAGLKFTPDADFNGTGNFSVQASTTNDDSGLGGSTALASVIVDAVNDTPDVVGPGSAYTVNEQTDLSIHGTGFSVTDVDAASGTMTTTIAVGEGAITVAEGDSGVTINSGNTTGSVVLTGTLAQINNLLTGAGTGTIVYNNGSDTPSATTNITVTVNDGGNTGSDPGLTADASSEEDSAVQTINVTAVNDDPTNAGTLPTDITVTEDVSTFIDLSSIDLSDPDHNNQLVIVTLQTSTGGRLFAGNDSDVIVFGSGTGTLTLQGGVNDINTFLNSATQISYLHGTSHTNGDNADTIQVTANDLGNTGTGGGTNQNLGTVNVDITAVNDEEVLATNTGTSVAESSTGNTVTTAMLHTTDVDNTDAQLVYTIDGVVSNGTLRLSGTALGLNDTFTQADIDAGNLTYDHDGSQTTADSFDFTVDDGAGTTTSSTFNFTVTNVNDAPVAANIEGTDLAYAENDGAVAVTSTITFTDVDDTNIESAIVQITGGYNSGEDVLSFTDQNGISGVYTSGTGMWTLTGTATLAQYETAIRSITYTNSSENPDESTRTVSFTVNDGDDNSNTLTRDITVEAVNDTPGVSGPGSAYTVNEQTNLSIEGTGFTVSDVDAVSGTMTATIVVGEGSLTLAAGDSGVTITANTASTVSFTGTLAQIDALLTGTSTGTITYNNGSDTPSATTNITLTVNDGGNTGTDPGTTADASSEEDSAVQTINITATNDNPTNAGSLPSDVAVTEDVLNNVDLSAVDFSDVDAGGSNLTVTLTTSTGGELTLAADGSLTFGGTATARTITGSIADLNTYFNTASNVQYLHGTTNRFGNDADTIQVVINDNGNTGTGGGTDQNLGTVNVDITAVNDEEVLATNTGTSVAEGSTGNTVTTAMLHTTDVDNTDAQLVYTMDGVVSNGSLRLSGTALGLNDTFTQADIDAGNLTYDHDGSQTSADSFDFTVNDGAGMTTSSTFNFTVTAVNDAPVAANIEGAALAYSENDGAVAVTSTITFTDVDDTNIESAIVQITGGYDSGEDLLSFPDQNGISGVYTSGTGMWTLTGTATLAQYETAIRSITYTNSSKNPDESTRTVSFTVNDGDANSNTLTRNITVEAVNDTPGVSGPGSAYTVNEQTNLSIEGTGFTVSDVDAVSGTMTATIVVGEGTLTLAAGDSGVTITANTASTVSFTGTLTQIDALLTGTSTGTITYNNGSDTPSATTNITLTVNDGGNTGTDPGTTADGSSEEDSATQTINITLVNDTPTITNLAGDTRSYSEGDGVQAIDQLANASVTDVDSVDFNGGNLTVVSSTSGDNTEDQLSIRNQGTGVGQIGFDGTNVTYEGTLIGTASGGANGADLVVTLNTNADADAVSALTQNVTYENSDTSNPTEDSRTISFTVNDGDGATSTASDVTISVSRVNDAPQNSLQATQSVGEDGTLVFSSANGNAISVNDVDSGTSDIRVTLTVTNGVFNLAGTTGLTSSSGDGTTTVTIEGPNSAIYAALNGASFTPTGDFNGTATLTMVTNDLGNTGTGGAQSDTDVMNITVNAINDDPFDANAGSFPTDITVTEDVVSNVDLSAVDFADVDAGASNLTVTLSTSTGGQLSASTGGGVTVGGTATAMTFTGSIADLNAYFNTASNVLYVHGTADTFGNDADTINVIINDNGNTGTGGSTDQNLGTVNVDITAVNDEEVLATNTGTSVAEGSTGNAVTTAMLHTTDVDNTDAQLVYTVTNVTDNGTLRLSGTALGLNDTFTQADIDAGLVTYDHNGSQTTTDAFGFRVDDGAGTTTSNTFNFTVTNVNDAPVVANVEGTALAYAENDGAVAITSTINFTDVDDTNIESAVVQITGSYISGEDSLAFVDQNGITGAHNAGSGTWTLTGSATLAEYETAIRSITYTNSSDDPSTLTRTVSFRFNDGDVNSNTQTRGITVAATNDDPTDSGGLPSDITVTEDVSSNVDLSSINLSDLDDNGGDLTVTLSTATGGGLSASSGGGVTIAGSGTGTMTLTGSLTDLNTFLDTPANVQYLHGTTHTFGNDVDTIQVVVNDGGNTGSGGGTDQTLGTVNVDISAVNDEQVLSTNAGNTVAEGSSGNTITTLMLETTDVDNTDAQLVYTVDTVPGNGTMYRNAVALSVNDTFTQADIDGGLITYDHDGSQTSGDSFDFTVDDGTGTTTSDTFTWAVINVNDASVVSSIESGMLNYTENDGAVAITSTLTLADVDDTDIESAVVAITGNFVTGEDALTFTNQNGILGSWNASNGTLTLSGTATVADYQVALRSVTYANTSDDPNAATRTVSFTINDGQASSNVTTRDISMTPVNDRPTIANLAGDFRNYLEGEGSVLIEQGGDVVVQDFDSPDFDGGSLTVSLTTGLVASEDVLDINNQGFAAGHIGVVGNTVSYGGLTIGTFAGGNLGNPLIVNFNASASQSAVTALIANISYENSNVINASAGVRSVEVALSDGDGQTSDLVTASISVQPVNQAPVAIGDSYSVDAGDRLTVAAPGVLSNDVDPDGDAIVAQLVTGAAHGVVSLSSNGAIVYTPNTGFFGQDSFRYQVSDGLLSSVVVQVDLDVNLVAVPPPSGGPSDPGTPDDPDSTSNEAPESDDSDPTSNSDPSLNPAVSPTEDPVDLVPDAATPQEAGAAGQTKGNNGSQSDELLGPLDEEEEFDSSSSRKFRGLDDIESKFFNIFGKEDFKTRFVVSGSHELQQLERLLQQDLQQAIIWTQWESQERQGEDRSATVFVGSAGAGMGMFSIGYVFWALRGGAVATALASSLPAWRFIDPSSMLTAYRGAMAVKERDLESLIDG